MVSILWPGITACLNWAKVSTLSWFRPVRSSSDHWYQSASCVGAGAGTDSASLTFENASYHLVYQGHLFGQSTMYLFYSTISWLLNFVILTFTLIFGMLGVQSCHLGCSVGRSTTTWLTQGCQGSQTCATWALKALLYFLWISVSMNYDQQLNEMLTAFF